jgi:hypothetical protein
MRHLFIHIGVIALLISPAAGQTFPADSAKPAYRAVRVETPPVIDGDLSDAVWQQAVLLTELHQAVPEEGGTPSEKTDVRVVYDDSALYVAFYAYEANPGRSTRTMMRYRWDTIWQLDDVVRFSLDTFHDHRRGYAFSFNAFGTKQDSQLDNGLWLSDWDEVWDVRTRLQDDGWSAEVRIPFRILRFPEGTQPQVWGLQIHRLIQRGNETIQWAPEPPNFGLSRLEYAGHLEGISGIRPARNVQIIPYVAAGANEFQGRDRDNTFDIGADAKLALGPAAALDLTYNTNFAQVEVDDQQINLTRFPLFFPEKREFFLEGAQLFNVGLGQDVQMFFSRRIGLAAGEPVPILGGARLTGKVGRFDVGVLTTQTKRHLAMPTANQSAGRVRWNVGSRSYIGGILTSVSSDLRTSGTFAADGRFWLSRYLRIDGFVGTLSDRGRSGRPVTFSTAAAYDQDRWGATLRTLRIDDDFNPALGFVRRRDIDRHDASLRRGWRLNRAWARKIDVAGDVTYLSDLQGRLDSRERNFWIRNELPSGDLFRFALESNLDRLDPADNPFVINPRQGIVIPPGDYTFNRWVLSYAGFEGRPYTVNLEVHGGDFYSGERSGLTFSGTWRTSPHLVLSGDYQRNDIRLAQGSFTTHLSRGRVSIPLTARAVVDAFVQWNGLTRDLNTQVRLHLIYGRDSNFYIVYTDYEADEAGRLVRQSRALQTKLAYRWYW